MKSTRRALVLAGLLLPFGYVDAASARATTKPVHAHPPGTAIASAHKLATDAGFGDHRQGRQRLRCGGGGFRGTQRGRAGEFRSRWRRHVPAA